MTIGKFNLLTFSLLSRSNENAAVIFYFAREFSLKKEAGYGRTFQFRLLMFSFRVSLYKEQLVKNIQQQGQNASKLTVSYKQNFVSFVC